MSKILIVCYSFPPNPGVGGRRWAKFVKYMIKSGHAPVIITNKPQSSDNSPWTPDIKDAEVHYINYGYPKSLDHYPKTLPEKVLYRFYHRYIRLMKGNYYDRSLFSENALTKKMAELIEKNNIKTVIVTCPPFRHAYFASKFKKKFQGLKLITDLRDPWTDNTTFLGFDSLSAKRRNYELALEKEVIAQSDKVICVNEYYKKLLEKRYPDEKNKFIHIMNGFDPEDVKSDFKSKEVGTIITCAGTVYNAVEFLFEPFLNFIVSEAEFLRKANIKFRFYGSVDGKVHKLIQKKHMEFIELHPLLDSAEIHNKLASSTAVMMFIAPNHGDNFNTKFYEYLAHRKPIILFSNQGEISEFIKSNSLGTHVGSTNFDVTLKNTLQLISSGLFEMNNKFGLDEFNVINLKDKLLNSIAHD